MDFCDAINKAIEDFGKDILLDGKRLFNILSDYQAFDNKAYRRAMDTLLSMGFGRQLYLLFDKTESERQIKIKSFISEIESEGFQREIICEVFDNIALAFYWEPVYSQISQIPETKEKSVPDVKQPTTSSTSQKSYKSSVLDSMKEFLEQYNSSISKPQISNTSSPATTNQKVKVIGGIVIPNLEHNDQMSDTLKETLKLAKQGKTLRGIARIRHLKVDTIEKHLIELIQDGHLKAKNFVEDSTYKELVAAYKALGNPSSGELNRYLSNSYRDYDSRDIRLVVADMERLKKTSAARQKASSSSSTSSSPKPKSVSRVQVLKSSKELFDMDCTVDITPSGYYLSFNGKHYKLADLCCCVTRSNPGQIWRMSPTVRGYEYRLVHYKDGERYPFGEIKSTYSEIKFKPEVGKIITIPL